MGDTRKFKKKYQTPLHPWNRKSIEDEKVLVKEYGLGKKKELHIAISFLKKYKDIAKKLIADRTAQGAVEKEQMMSKLIRLGLLSSGAKLDNVLGLELKDVLERRIQSRLYRRSLARSMKQARQFIVHGHVAIGNKTITSPSYMLSLVEESSLCFCSASALALEDHPERAIAAKEVKAEVTKIKDKIVESAKLESGNLDADKIGKIDKTAELLEVEKGVAEEIAKEELENSGTEE
ncbi:30S ribosomal protein S4 [Candidatus Woesearchaeota archaeon]|nr:30S ribosomal protein S4 [Candidatus Woesearchaeota archaeon]